MVSDAAVVPEVALLSWVKKSALFSCFITVATVAAEVEDGAIILYKLFLGR